MRVFLCLGLLTIAFSPPAIAGYSGYELKKTCEKFLHFKEHDDNYDAVEGIKAQYATRECAYYIAGFYAGIVYAKEMEKLDKQVCLPRSIRVESLAEDYIKFIEQNKSFQSLDAAAGLYAIMMNSFPCPK